MEEKTILDTDKQKFSESKEECEERVNNIIKEIDSWPDYRRVAIAYEPKSLIRI